MKTEEAAYESSRDRRKQTLAINIRYLEVICVELKSKQISIKQAIDTIRRVQQNLLKIE